MKMTIAGMEERIDELLKLHADNLKRKYKAEIERAIDKIKLGVVPGRKRTKDGKWWRKQWYRSMMRDRKRAQHGKRL
jgi:hypothetical protein